MKLSTLQKGLVFHAPLSEERYNPATKRVDDLTPYENHGISANTPVFTTDRMGQADRALSFNGTSDYVNCGNDESLNFGDGANDSPFSISAWIKMDVAGGFNIIRKGESWTGAEWGFVVVGDNKLILIQLDNSTGNAYIGRASPPNLSDYVGQWINVVGIYNGNKTNSGTKLYLNGVQIDNADRTAGSYVAMENGNENAWIGKYKTDYANGSIADVRIYNRALSQPEITALYEAYRPKILLKSQYGIAWDESANTYERTVATARFPCGSSPGNAYMPIQADMRRCLLSDAGVVQYYLDPLDSTKKADGTASDLTGGDGQVMVEIPKFYYKHSYAGTTHTWEIARGPIAGFSLHPAFMKNGVEVSHRYIGAYEGSMWDATTSAMVSSADIITNMYAAGDKLCSISGEYPKTNELRSEFRGMGANRGAGWRQLDFDLNSAVQLLYIIEYGDFDSQTEIGYGRTQLSGGSWTAGSYIGQCGKSNSDGDGTNSVAGNTNNAYMTYHGIENWYGNVWKWVDGININNRVPYVSNTDTDFADDTATNYTNLGVTLAAANNWQITLADTDRGFLPASVGADATYVSDYYYQSIGWRVVLLGGHAYAGASAGAFYVGAYAAASHSSVSIGGRLAY